MDKALKDALPTAESSAVDKDIVLAKEARRRWNGYSFENIRDDQAVIAGYIQACAIQALANELVRTREALVKSIDALQHAIETAADHS